MSQRSAMSPPKWPLKFLRLFLNKEYLEEIEGDMEELFYENIENFNERKAKRLYTWETVKLIRPILLNNLTFLQRINQFPMFKNYFKVSFRGLMKNPVNSFINIFGLAVAIGVCVFAYAFTHWTISTDQFHEHKNEVFLVTFFSDRDGAIQQYGTTPRPLGEMLKEDFAQVNKVCRVEDRNIVMKQGDNVFHERVRYTDPEFLDMFTFPLKWGTKQSLSDLNSIILSEAMSVKYFGEENPIGQSMLMINNKNQSKAFKVTGVANEFPKARTIAFDFLVNFENLKVFDPSYDPHDWKSFVNATLIQVNDPLDIINIRDGMEKYKKLQNDAIKEDWAISSFSFEPLATLHKASEFIRDDISRSSRENYISIIFMFVISIFLLMLACFNYINIAIVTATKRLKEIGVRKSIGATRRVVLVQFLAENVLITFFAMAVGLVLGMTIFIPGFERLWHFSMDFKLADPTLWMYLPAVLLITSIASGIYPSLYISKFQVVSILKGSVRFGKNNTLTKVFLGFQLIMACIFITMAVMFTQNTSYLTKRSWGYDQEHTLYAVLPNPLALEELQAKISQNPDVLSSAGSVHHLGKSHTKTILHFPDKEVEVDQLAVGTNYFETMGLQLKEGRTFTDYEGSNNQTVVINETLANNMNWESAIGQQFKIDTTMYEVVGILSEFHNYSFSKQVRPIIFTLADKNQCQYLSLKVSSGSEIKTYKSLQSNWSELLPEIPFEGGLQEDVWGFYYQEISIYDLVWKVFAFMAVALAGLGLFGLARLNVASRTKEFSIRKVLGAGLKNIASTITSQYIALFSVALTIGTPLGHFLAVSLIQFTYPYHRPIDLSATAISAIILVIILMFTISTQIRKVAISNPVNGLKTE